MDAVSSHAAEHHSLLQQLGELDYAHSALDQAKARLAGLRKDLEEQKKELSEVEKKTRKEYDDWQKVQNSVLRRAKLRVKGGKDNLEARVEKEEREWLEALREVRPACSLNLSTGCEYADTYTTRLSVRTQEGRQKDRIATTQREIDETEELVKDLAGLSDQHTRVQKRLDSMYEHVFAGPSTSVLSGNSLRGRSWQTSDGPTLLLRLLQAITFPRRIMPKPMFTHWRRNTRT